MFDQSLFEQPLAFVDLETSGATANFDRITEVGIVTVNPDGGVDEWSTLVNPGVRIPLFIESLTGISNAMVENAPPFEHIAAEVLRRLEGRLFIAHNVRFDHGFLRQELARLGHKFRPRLLCTVKLSRTLYPQQRRHNLDSLIERHQLECGARHRALGDAQVLWQFVKVVQKEFDAGVIANAINIQLQTPTLPPGLPADALEDLPYGPGVYLFHDERNAPLYVGKSVKLRSRVLSHFAGDHSSSKDMRISQQVARIECIETAGELGALLTEACLVKQLLPVHNRMLRRSQDLCVFLWSPGELSSDAPKLARASDIDPLHLGDTFGVFRSKRKALEALQAIADEYGLCPQLLGLEPGGTRPADKGANIRNRPCFAHQIHKCRGACCGKETLAAHNLRLLEALTKLRLKAWPYKGRIGIRESSEDAQRTDIHVIDHWCYLGTVRSEPELFDHLATRMQPVFDIDTYRILIRFLERKRGNLEIVPLGESATRPLALELPG